MYSQTSYMEYVLSRSFTAERRNCAGVGFADDEKRSLLVSFAPRAELRAERSHYGNGRPRLSAVNQRLHTQERRYLLLPLHQLHFELRERLP